MRKILGLALSVAILPTFASGSAALANNWIQPESKPGTSAINLVDEFIYDTSRLISYEQNGLRGGSSREWSGNLCQSSFDEECLSFDNDHLVYATMVIPACEQDDSSDCIQGVTVITDGSEAVAGYLGEAAGPTYEHNPSTGLPAGRTTSLWQPDGSVAKFAVHGVMEVRLGRNGKFSYHRLNLAVVPYVSRSGNFSEPANSEFINGEGIQKVGFNPPQFGCVWVTRDECGEVASFTDGARVSVSLKLSNDLSGWVFGRLTAPEISITPIDEKFAQVVISAEPMEVPKLFGQFDLDSPPAEVREVFQEGYPTSDGITSFFSSHIPDGLLDAFRVILNDTAAGSYENWSFGTANGGKCVVPGAGLQGVVTTNASSYQSGAPAFRDGILSYRVGGLHYAEDGTTLNVGTYDLQIRMDVARCLYGFSRAPVSATVSVVGENGEENVATTIVSEKDGWLKLAAYGFTFSEKEIQVQLRQSQIKTLTNFTSTSLSAKQKAEIRSVLSKSDGNTKFICTGIRYFNQPVSENIRVRARAKAACDYAKSINPDLSYWYQTKTTQARSYNGKVMVVSKG